MPAHTPARYAVLLRGINVGGNNRLSMEDLRQVLGDLGLGDPGPICSLGRRS